MRGQRSFCGAIMGGVAALALLAGSSIVIGSLTPSGPAQAAERGGGHSGSSDDHSSGHESGGSKGGRGGQGAGGKGKGGAGGGHSVQDKVFRAPTDSHSEGSDHAKGDHDSGSVHEEEGDEHADSGKRGPKYMGGRSLLDSAVLRGGEEEESDRPPWAGAGGGKAGGREGSSGGGKGELYGDLYVIVRDANGAPILYVWQDSDGDGVPDAPVLSSQGFPQPIDGQGNLIPLSAEGEPISEDGLQEVEFGRLNVARSPSRVLASRYAEAVSSINRAEKIELDSAGRLVLTIDGEPKTIDSPLENLGLYVELMNTGTLGGVAVDPAKLGGLAHLVDGRRTVDDLKTAASFLAGAADKYGTLTVDQVVYINAILGLQGAYTGVDGKAYVDFGGFDYSRLAAFGPKTAQVLVEKSSGVWALETVSLYDAVFGGQEAVATGAAGFARAADDALQVIEFIHDFEAPAPTTGG